MKSFLHSWKNEFEKEIQSLGFDVSRIDYYSRSSTYVCNLENKDVLISICHWPESLFEVTILGKNDGRTLKIETFDAVLSSVLNSNIIELASAFNL